MKKFLLPFVAVLLMLLGCQPKPKTPFVWQGYSESLYYVKDELGEESVKHHLELLKSLIDRAKEYESLQVPPGVYAEYGYYLMEQGKTAKGKKYFQKEKELYPESEKFINQLVKRIENGQ